jgi:hypothetical protein
MSALRARRLSSTVGIVLYLAEFYFPDLDAADFAQRARTAAELAGIHFVEAIAVPSDESCFALFEAPSLKQVQAAANHAGIAVDRVVEAVSIAPQGPTTGSAARRRKPRR